MTVQDEIPLPASGNFPIPTRAREKLEATGMLPSSETFRPPPGKRRDRVFDWPAVGAATWRVAEQDAIYPVLAEACSLPKDSPRREAILNDLRTRHAMKVEFGIDLIDSDVTEVMHND